MWSGVWGFTSTRAKWVQQGFLREWKDVAGEAPAFLCLMNEVERSPTASVVLIIFTV